MKTKSIDSKTGSMKRRSKKNRRNTLKLSCIPNGLRKVQWHLRMTALQFLLILGVLSSGKLVGMDEKTNPENKLSIYIVDDPTSNMILPNSILGEEGNNLYIIGAKGEYESCSFVLKSSISAINNNIKITDLKGKDTVIPQDNLDIKIVKCWYQRTKSLTPELLVKDDKLIITDYQKKINYIKLKENFPGAEAHYVSVVDDKSLYEYVNTWGTSRWKLRISNGKFPIQDALELLPFDLSKDENKQFIITIKIPENINDGIFIGDVHIKNDKNMELGSLKLNVRVLPFKLPEPMTHYDISKEFTCSLYHDTAVNPKLKTEESGLDPHSRSIEQLRKEYENLLKYGITNPAIYQLYYYDLVFFRKVLKLRKEIGLKTSPVFLCAPERNIGFGIPTYKEKLKSLKKKVTDIIDIVCEEYGHQDIYFYGWCEAKGEDLTAQISAWNTIHEAGGKIFVAGASSQRVLNGDDNFSRVGNIQDLLVCAFEPLKEEATKWHSQGHKIFSYANPQGGLKENPDIYRKNYGFALWFSDYDGAMTFAYHEPFGHPYNDYDSKLKDHNFVYPTIDGVIDTLAFIGYREAFDDIKYATKLKEEIIKAKNNSGKINIANDAENFLEQQNSNSHNNTNISEPNLIRLQIIQYILKLIK